MRVSTTFYCKSENMNFQAVFVPKNLKLCIFFHFTFAFNMHLMSEFNEFELRIKSNKNWFQLSTGLNLEMLNTILS